jgi:hypothetical protein
MVTIAATFDLTLLYFVAANVLCLLGYVLVIKHRERAILRKKTLVAKVVVDYFRDGGSVVGAECMARNKGRRFVVLISTRPNRRFRNSHVVEFALTTHVRKTCGLDLEKVYWCFPVKEKPDAAQREAAPEGSTLAMKGDEYFDEESFTHSKPPGYRVRELSRERFEALATKQRVSLGSQPAPASAG